MSRLSNIGKWNPYIKEDRIILSKMSKQVYGMPLHWRQLIETGRRRGKRMHRYSLLSVVYHMHLCIAAMKKDPRYASQAKQS